MQRSPRRDADGILFGCCLHLCQGAFWDASPSSVGLVFSSGTVDAWLWDDSVSVADPVFQDFFDIINVLLLLQCDVEKCGKSC